jgi:hypothetical protein
MRRIVRNAAGIGAARRSCARDNPGIAILPETFILHSSIVMTVTGFFCLHLLRIYYPNRVPVGLAIAVAGLPEGFTKQ